MDFMAARRHRKLWLSAWCAYVRFVEADHSHSSTFQDMRNQITPDLPEPCYESVYPVELACPVLGDYAFVAPLSVTLIVVAAGALAALRMRRMYSPEMRCILKMPRLPPENRLLVYVTVIAGAWNAVLGQSRVSWLVYFSASAGIQIDLYNTSCAIFVFVILCLAWMRKLLVCLRVLFLPRRRQSSWQRNWTIAASKDVFSAATNAVFLEHSSILFVVIFVMGSLSLLVPVKHVMYNAVGEAMDKYTMSILVPTNFVFANYLFLVSIFLPNPLLANAAVAEAIRLRGGKQLQRMRVCHWATAAAAIYTISTHDKFTWNVMALPSAVPPVLLAAACCAWQFGFGVRWGLQPRFDTVYERVVSCFWTVLIPVVFAILAVWVGVQGHIKHGNNLVEASSLALAAKVAIVLWLWPVNLPAAIECLRTLRHNELSSQSISRQFKFEQDCCSGLVRARRLTLYMILCSLSIPQIDSFVSLFATWSCTALFGVYCILIQEMESDFGGTEIERSPAYNGVEATPELGLVVSSYDLAAGLEVMLEGGGTADAEPNIRLRCYKANMFRMEHALALSYRWQSLAHAIGVCSSTGNLIKVNLSVWQMTQLLQAIRATGLRYVWLDVLSVPQPPLTEDMLEVQRTLLTRMMAVYVAARRTLVLKSLEYESGRYHQRAWTFQEFCAASKIDVALEGPVQESCDGAVASSTLEEVQQLQALREMIQDGMQECRPLWTRRGINDSTETGVHKSASSRGCRLPGGVVFTSLDNDELRHRARIHQEMSEKLHCRNDADLVRALLPILFHCPVEKHEELVQLVTYVQQSMPDEASIEDSLLKVTDVMHCSELIQSEEGLSVHHV